MSGTQRSEAVADGVIRVPLASSTLPPFTHTNAYLLASDGVGLEREGGSQGGAPGATIAMELDHSVVDEHADGGVDVDVARRAPHALEHAPDQAARLEAHADRGPDGEAVAIFLVARGAAAGVDVALEHEHAAAVVREHGGGGRTGQACADDDGVVRLGGGGAALATHDRTAAVVSTVSRTRPWKRSTASTPLAAR